MTDLDRILPLWRELEASGADYVLATLVAVEGSSYRRPGARMLLAQDGRRVGTVSGGCLEAEVASRAWWLTANGPAVERYSTADDDGERPYGSGCGGVIYLLLERRSTAHALLMALEAAFNRRAPLAIATVLEGPRIAERAFACSTSGKLEAPVDLGAPSFRLLSGERVGDHEADPVHSELQHLADLSLARRASLEERISTAETSTRVWADYRAARPGLWIFGAGDDARPLVSLARELGWFVAVADGRSHLATRTRFSAADEVLALDIAALPGAESARFDLHPTDAAVVMTHSFEQDTHILATLLSLGFPLAYLGVLGPQRRTREVLAEAARLLDFSGPVDEHVEQWLTHMHAPTGLDLGAEAPAAVALSILAEAQQALNHGTALPLKQVRATRAEVPQP